ncbi:S8 family serine peptidase [Streptomyces hainanensis]|uniref:Peptidase S8/S53 domain-containing protein n=1 Tax=Streptomyces hainanensis TaxID=402648 RepID=A0A4R4TW70_9ACTN|nr:S8 family serine peptidase [Streptomyces hainanensis]TDC78369.1 hypothetical protein E1283_05215 [Streptomyces hainanensis]
MSVFPQDDPNDPFYKNGLQWNLKSGAGINAREAWKSSLGSGVVIAVIDSGYTPHSDLQLSGADKKYLPGVTIISRKNRENPNGGAYYSNDALDTGTGHDANFCRQGERAVDSAWHGTAVMGIAAAATNNEKYIAAVAPDAVILPIRVEGPCGIADTDIATAVQWLGGYSVPGLDDLERNTPKVVNISVGGAQGACKDHNKTAFEILDLLEIVVVLAATNGDEHGNPLRAGNTYPLNCSQSAIVVGAVDKLGNIMPGSGRGGGGREIDVVAPGVAVQTLKNTGTRGPDRDTVEADDGTSFAAPHVAGIAALILAKYPKLKPPLVKKAIMETARDGQCKDNGGNQCGKGLVDANAALNRARELNGEK